MTNNKILWLSFTLIIAACLSIALMINNIGKTNTDKKESSLNAYMTGLTYAKYNEQGQLTNHLRATRMEHFAKDNTAYFTDPKILMYTNKRTPWHISAAFGKSHQGSSQVFLWDGVKIHRPQHINYPATTITTSEITVFPKRSYAKTNRPVTIVRDDSVIKGIGLIADFKKSFFKLLSQSRGVYESDQQPKQRNPNK